MTLVVKPPCADLVLQTEAVYYWDTAEDILRKWFTAVELEHAVTNKKVRAAYAPVTIDVIPDKKAKLCKRFKTALVALEGEIAKVDPEMRTKSVPATPTTLRKRSPITPEPRVSPLSIMMAWRWGSKLLEVEAAALESGMPPSSITYLRDSDNWAHVTVLAALRYQYQSVLLELLPLEKEMFKIKDGDSTSSSSAVITMLKENTKDALVGVLDCCKNAESLKGIAAVEQSLHSSHTPSPSSNPCTLSVEELFAIKFFKCEVETISARYQLAVRRPDIVPPVVDVVSGVAEGGKLSLTPVPDTTAAQPPATTVASGGCVIM